MTLFEFKQAHPKAKGNLCYNCRHLCTDKACARCARSFECDMFVYIDDSNPSKDGNAEGLIKALERDYYDNLEQASRYFNRLASYIGK